MTGLCFVQGSPAQKFPISWNKLPPRHNTEDRNGGLQLDLSTCDVCETKENVQMDKEKFSVEINLQVCECVFPVISVSLTDAAVLVTEGDNIMAD